MSISAIVDALVDAGCTPEQIGAAVCAAETKRQAEDEARRAKARKYISSWESKRLAIFKRDGFLCVYCGSDEQPLHCDHVIPWSHGGSSDFDNLVTACAACNSSNQDRAPEEWRRA